MLESEACPCESIAEVLHDVDTELVSEGGLVDEMAGWAHPFATDVEADLLLQSVEILCLGSRQGTLCSVDWIGQAVGDDDAVASVLASCYAPKD